MSNLTPTVTPKESVTSESATSPTLLERVKRLVEEKTRFSAADIQEVSNKIYETSFDVETQVELSASLVKDEIYGNFTARKHDVNARSVEEATAGAAQDKAGALKQARGLFTELLEKTQAADIESESRYFADRNHWQLSACNPCSGSGHVTCHECSGACEVTCGNCHGDGHTRCTACLNGQTSCASCGGSGQVSYSDTHTEYVSVSYTDSNGYTQYRSEPRTVFVTKYRNCYGCYGSGKTTCMICHGRSQVDCLSCGTRGRVRCPVCRGSGDVGCGYCHTTGRVGYAIKAVVSLSTSHTMRLPTSAPQEDQKILTHYGYKQLIPQSVAYKLKKQDQHPQDDNGSRYALTLVEEGVTLLQKMVVQSGGHQYDMVAWGKDHHFHTLDNIVEDLLVKDLTDLATAVKGEKSNNPLRVSYKSLIKPLAAITASEINADIVEEALNDKKSSNIDQGVVSENYAQEIRGFMMDAMSLIYTRKAKDFAWQFAVLVLFYQYIFGPKHFEVGSLIMSFLLSSLCVIPAYYAFRFFVKSELARALSSQEKAVRAMSLVEKSGGAFKAKFVIASSFLVSMASITYIKFGQYL